MIEGDIHLRHVYVLVSKDKDKDKLFMRQTHRGGNRHSGVPIPALYYHLKGARVARAVLHNRFRRNYDIYRAEIKLLDKDES